MLTRLSQWQAVTLFFAALISWPGSALAAGAQRERAPAGRPSVAAATSQAAVPQNPWPLIHIPDPVVRRVTVTALEKGASEAEKRLRRAQTFAIVAIATALAALTIGVIALLT